MTYGGRKKTVKWKDVQKPVLYPHNVTSVKHYLYNLRLFPFVPSSVFQLKFIVVFTYFAFPRPLFTICEFKARAAFRFQILIFQNGSMIRLSNRLDSFQ